MVGRTASGKNIDIRAAGMDPAAELDFSDYFRECGAALLDEGRPVALEYLMKDRGLTCLDRLKQLNIGFDACFSAKKDEGGLVTFPAIVFPMGKKGATIKPLNDSSIKYVQMEHPGFFNPDALYDYSAGPYKPIFITEGPIDALSLMCFDGVDAIALSSASAFKPLIDALKKRKTTRPLIISLDNDMTGKAAARKLKAAFDALKVYSIKCSIYGTYKDANERLLADRSGLLKNIEKTVESIGKDYDAWKKDRTADYCRSTSCGGNTDAFIGEIDERACTKRISTDFRCLDQVLGGGLYDGLYVFGALSSLGKTTLMLQIADAIADQGGHVLFFSLEMSRYELMAKSISRLTYMMSGGDRLLQVSARGILAGELYASYSAKKKQHIQDAVMRYAGYNDNVFIVEGVGDLGVEEVRKAVEYHIECTGVHPVVMVDYLQILAPYYEARMTDKQNTDKNVVELRRIARECKCPVITISSFNRESYKGEITMAAFKESGAIEYGADVLLALQFKGCTDDGFNIKAAKAQNPRDVELVILKNRNGKSDQTIGYKYFPAFNCFEEEGIIVKDFGEVKK